MNSVLYFRKPKYTYLFYMEVIRRGSSSDYKKLSVFLADAKLPVEDFSAMSHFHLWVCDQNGAVSGFAGVEKFGHFGLLRSVVVNPEERGNGIGTKLLQTLERDCRNSGIIGLYLLTETAEPFFTRHGYEKIDRSEAVEAIRKSSEFTTACSKTAVLMMKTLR